MCSSLPAPDPPFFPGQPAGYPLAEGRKQKVAIYCRLSEEDRDKKHDTDESGSIQNQKAMLLEYAGKQGWELYRLYCDEDCTGADRRRPEFNRLLQDAEQRRFDIVLCKTQSRFTRELELVEKYIHGLFPLWGIRFVSVVDNADTENKGNKKSRQINGLVNEWYLEDLSENIRSVLDNRRRSGFHIGSFAPYGYKKDPEKKGHLLIDEEAAAVVREVFTRFAQGCGKTAIARSLNDRGIPNPTEYKRLQGLRYQQPKRQNGTLWKYYSISHMLVNPVYIGNLVQGKTGSVSYKTKQCKPRPPSQWYIVEGTHAPIIDRDLWERVQTKIAQRTKPFGGGTVGLFAQKARCAQCGYTMKSSKTSPQRGGKHYLQCSSRHVAKEACAGAFISVDRLERMVLAEMRRLLDAYLDQDQLEREVQLPDTLQEQKKQWVAHLEACEKKAAEYAKGLQELYLDKTKGLLSEAMVRELAQGFAAERDRLEQAKGEGEKQLAQLEEKIAAVDYRRLTLEPYIHPDRLTREMVEELIDCILVGKRIPGTREVPLEIQWNF